MRPHHKACGSISLTRIQFSRGRRTMSAMFCNHCARLIETYEIEQPSRIIVRKVTFDNAVNSNENRKEILTNVFGYSVVD